MNAVQILLVLRARYVVVLIISLGTIAATLAVSLLLPKQYTATTALMVDMRSPDPVAAVLLPPMMVPGNVATQVDIIGSDRVAHKVVTILGLDKSPVVRQQWLDITEGKGKLDEWLAALMQKKVRVTPSRESNVISIAYVAAEPGFAAAVANAYAQAYIETSIELKVEPARQYANWFGDQAKVLRENVEKAQARLSEFQQQSGIVATDETLDYENTKLTDLSTQLTIIQGQRADAQSKQRSGKDADSLPEIMQSPLVQSLRTNIALLEVKMKESAVNLGNMHPQYQRMESELAELKNRLEVETRHVTSSYSATSNIGKSKETEVRGAFETQKRKLLTLKKQRDELAVLMRDVATAKNAYDAVTNRYNQTTLESRATQTNVSVLSPAIEPLEPSYPNPFKFVLAAILGGPLLGAGAAFLLEMADRRVRSVDDLAALLQRPVLGVIQRERQQGRLRRYWTRRKLPEAAGSAHGAG